ncbi:TPA: hypothetical protein ACX6Q7_001407 [Photobacterium damselae]
MNKNILIICLLLSGAHSNYLLAKSNDENVNKKPSPMIAIDSLVKFADKNHTAYISVINSGKSDAYLIANMNKIEIKDNKLIKNKLSIKNMKDWKLFLSPTKMILRAGEEKKIKVSYNCKDNCKIDKDVIYQIPITPVPYTDKEGASSVSMAFGFSPYFIVPASKSLVDYKYDIKDGMLDIENKGNTYINAVISTCAKVQKNNCIYEYKILSGRKMKFKLPKDMISKGSALMTVVNYDQSYRKTDKINFN